MGNSEGKVAELADNFKEYIETRIELIKLETADSGASAVSTMMSWFIILVIAFIFLLTLTIGVSIGIGYIVDNFATGFFIVTGFYFLVGLILYANRTNWLRKPFINTIIKNIYDNE